MERDLQLIESAASKERELGYYLGHILFGLIVAQLMENNQDIIVALGVVIILVHSFFIFSFLNDHFLFVIYLFSLCLISTFDVIGGICLVPILILLNYVRAPGLFTIKNLFVKICFFVLVACNFAGYFIKNPSGLSTIIQSIIIFGGFVMTFLFVQNFTLTKSRISILFKVFTAISILAFVVTVNQKYVIIDTSLPLLGSVNYPSVRALSYAYYGRFPSLLGDYELFAEFSLLMFILSFTLIMTRRGVEHYNLGVIPFILLLVSFVNILMTGTRSAFLLAVVFVFLFFVVRLKSLFTISAARLGVILLVALPFVVMFGNSLGLGTIVERLKEINPENLSIQNLRSGAEMNRNIVYAAGYDRLAQDNWLIGYGFGRVGSNKLAWFGDTQESSTHGIIEDFHSLYLSLPMIYGWIGGIAYLAMLVFIVFSLFKKYLLFKDQPFGGIILGFGFLFVFFLVDQIKINSLRYHFYHLMIWILMGFALSIINSKTSTDEDTVVY